MNSWPPLIALCVVLVSCCGCSSLATHIPNKAPGPYGGVRADSKMITHPRAVNDSVVVGHIPRGVVRAYALLDLPFSAVVDTLLLPIDLTYRKPKQSPDSNK